VASTSVEPASGVESAAAPAEGATAVETASTIERVEAGAAMESAYRSVPNDPRAAKRSETRPANEARPSPESRMAIEAVEPRARADEDAARKPLRPVVTIRRARVRVVGVVAVGAHRGCANVSRRAKPDSNEDPLRLRKACGYEAKTQHRENS